MTPETLRAQVAEVAAQIAGRALDAELDAWLNREHGPASTTFARLKRSCEAGVAGGWLCNREGGGIRYGRIFKPADDLFGFSVDVVDMAPPRWAAPSPGQPAQTGAAGTPTVEGEADILAGPHHLHPNGEIDLVMPIAGDAHFDGRPAGWVVMPPGSAHRPTVTRGRALVLYLLPHGAIEFTR